MRGRKGFAVGLCLCLLFPGVVSVETAASFTGANSTGSPRIYYIDAASFYDYGWKVGGLFNAQYRLLEMMASSLVANSSLPAPSDNSIDTLKAMDPGLWDETQGLADRLGTNPLYLLHLRDMLMSCVGECTVIETTGNATADGHTYLAQNFDTNIGTIRDRFFSTFLTRFGSWLFYVVRINTMRYRYAAIGLPVLFEIPLLNEEGLGFGAPSTRFTTNPNRTIDTGPGITTFELERLTLMTCRNVSEAAHLWETSERACEKGMTYFNKYDGSTPCFCDKDGGIVMIEQTHSYIKCMYGDDTMPSNKHEGILWHANHHLWLDPNLTGSIFPDEFPSSKFRTERTYQLLCENYGNITFDIIGVIMRDCKGGTNPKGEDSMDICRRPDKNGTYVTALSWIINAQKLTVSVAHGLPRTSVYWKRNFTSIFVK